jgi:hypothetical protein
MLHHLSGPGPRTKYIRPKTPRVCITAGQLIYSSLPASVWRNSLSYIRSRYFETTTTIPSAQQSLESLRDCSRVFPSRLRTLRLPRRVSMESTFADRALERHKMPHSAHSTSRGKKSTASARHADLIGDAFYLKPLYQGFPKRDRGTGENFHKHLSPR